MMGYDHMMWGFGGFSMIFFWGILIVGLVLLIKWIIQQGKISESRQAESSIDILKKRYAQGELEKEEYEEMKKVLIS